MKITRLTFVELGHALSLYPRIEKFAGYPDIELVDEGTCKVCGGATKWEHRPEDDGPGTAIWWVCDECRDIVKCLTMGVGTYVARHEDNLKVNEI